MVNSQLNSQNLSFSTIQHVSFDVWLTLIKSNPTFKTERVNLLKHFFKIPHSVDEITSLIRLWDLRFTKLNELSGLSIDSREMYFLLLLQLDADEGLMHEAFLNNYYLEQEELFFKYHPTLIEENLQELLIKLKQKNISLSIYSNTGFIDGSTLRKLFLKLNVGNLFDFQLYSNELNCSKPSHKAFQHIKNEVAKIKYIDSNSILHIGDNPVADYGGAINAGMQGAIINSNGLTLNQLIIS